VKSNIHRAMVNSLRTSVGAQGYQMIVLEFMRADMWGAKLTPNGFHLLAGEAETSPRNCIANIMRDLTVCGAHHVAVLAANMAVREQLVAKINRYLPESLKTHVRVFTQSELDGELFGQWIKSVEIPGVVRSTMPYDRR